MFRILIAEDDRELRMLFARTLEKHGYSTIGVSNGKEALEALEATDPKDIDPKNLLAFIREATKLEREARAAVVHAADPRRDEEKNGTGLADVIAEAWERRQNGETDD